MNFYDLLKALGHEPESIFVDSDLIEIKSNKKAVDFYSESKHGKTLHSLLKGVWDFKKVENYLDKVGGRSHIKYIRIIDFISKNAGLDTRKYKTIGQQLPDLMKQLEILYKDFLTSTETETELQQNENI